MCLKARSFLVKEAAESVWKSFEISCCCHECGKIIVIFAGKREYKYECLFENGQVDVIPVKLTYKQWAYKIRKNPLKVLAAAVTVCELMLALM